MINKIILFGDFKSTLMMDSKKEIITPLKNAAISRIAYGLRKKGFDVKQIHHCTKFSKKELEQIILNFSAGEEILVAVSSSFLSSSDTKNKSDKKPSHWGIDSLQFLLNIGLICKKNKYKYIIGGWEINPSIIKDKSYNIDYLKEYVTYFIQGSDFSIIENICKNKSIAIDKYSEIPFIYSNNIVDFSDCASTYLPQDCIQENESLITEIAAGCIFSCSYCDYAALGKKKNEYTRKYESFEREVKENYNNFKTTLYTLTDNIVNDTPEKIRYLIDVREKNGIDLKWVGYTRLDTIQNIEHAKLLKESGMVSGAFGIESFYKPSGKYIGKVTDKTRLLKCLEILRKVFEDELIITGLFIAGLPEEPIDHMIETYEWLNSTDGRYFIDQYSCTALVLRHSVNDKNPITLARNNPFKDYKGSLQNWISPWATYEDVRKIARTSIENCNNFIGCFNLPIHHNSGAKIMEMIKYIRMCGKNNIKVNVEDIPKEIGIIPLARTKYFENYKAMIFNNKDGFGG